MLHNSHFYLVTKYLITLKGDSKPFKQQFPIPHFLQPIAATNLLPDTMDLPILDCS